MRRMTRRLTGKPQPRQQVASAQAMSMSAAILEEAAMILAEQVAHDRPARLDIGVRADENRAPVVGRNLVGGQVAPDNPRLLVV